MAKNANNPNDNGSDLSDVIDIEELKGLPGQNIGNKGQGQSNGQQVNNNADSQDNNKGQQGAGSQSAQQGQGDQGQSNSGQGQQGQDNNVGDEPKIIAIDKVDYKLDDKGNAVKADGTIFKTADEIKALIKERGTEDTNDNNDANQTTAIEDYQKISGVIPVGEDGKPKVYEDTLEGVFQLAKDTADIHAQKTFESVLNSQPAFKEYWEYLNRGGKPEDFHKQQASSWKHVKFDGKNTDLLKNAVVAQLVTSGMKEEKAKLTAKMYEDTNQLEEMGKDAYDTLVANENTREKAEKESYNAQIKAQEESNNKYWEGVENTVKTGKLKNVTIPDSERPDFFKYIGVAVDKRGNSQADLDEQALSTEQWLEWRYLMLFKKGDMSKFINAKAGTKQASGIKQRFASSGNGLGDGNGADKSKLGKGNGTLDHFNMDDVMGSKK